MYIQSYVQPPSDLCGARSGLPKLLYKAKEQKQESGYGAPYFLHAKQAFELIPHTIQSSGTINRFDLKHKILSKQQFAYTLQSTVFSVSPWPNWSALRATNKANMTFQRSMIVLCE